MDAPLEDLARVSPDTPDHGGSPSLRREGVPESRRANHRGSPGRGCRGSVKENYPKGSRALRFLKWGLEPLTLRQRICQDHKVRRTYRPWAYLCLSFLRAPRYATPRTGHHLSFPRVAVPEARQSRRYHHSQGGGCRADEGKKPGQAEDNLPQPTGRGSHRWVRAGHPPNQAHSVGDAAQGRRGIGPSQDRGRMKGGKKWIMR